MAVKQMTQQGHTTRQMKAAPQCAVYIWCNNNLNYPRDLAKHLLREDLTICPQAALTHPAKRRLFALPPKKPIVVDHALVIQAEQRSIIWELSRVYDIIQFLDL